ncbi:oligoendopeptidase F [Halorhabdus amylolytica]|uniref:oligoendopeptidase F n=1 Tax=Halorhabdus amylolytica TaxID=2559573 RepID=UPI0010AAE06A|nr:oligoendopeptidase F [Halorhabdus amylolytica]
MSSVPERSEVDEEYTWALESLYADSDEWETAYEEAEELTELVASYEGRSTADAETLLSVLEDYENLMRTVSNVVSYARMRRDEDTRRDEAQAMLTRAQSLSAEASSAASFLDPEIQDLDREDVEAMIESEPALAEYDHYFDDVLRMKPHTRSTEVESLLADLSEVTGAPGEVYDMLTNADMTFPTVEDPEGEATEITLNNFTTLQKRHDRAFRQDVYEAFYDEWETVHNTVGTAYAKAVKTDSKMAAARNYDSAREASLNGPNVPVEVYDTLVETVRDNLGTLHRHAELKRAHTDGDDLRMWDLYVPLTETESPEIEYEEACEHVVDALAPLGTEYQSRVADGLDSRWVDVYETRGKQSGAYSGGTYDSQPYILMNFQDDVDSMYTLAHELGHSLHSEYTSETQPYVYSGYEIFVAEVASTVNEALLTRHLLETVEDDRFRRHVLDQYLERFRSTLFRQTMFAEFEHRTHEMSEAGEPLTPDRLNDLYRELKADYYEPGEIDDRIAREWMRIPHFYRSFYVYQYATGISAAVAIAQSIDEEGEPAASRYRKFLESGSSDYPLELLRTAGVDMADSDPIENAIEEYDDALEHMENLI